MQSFVFVATASGSSANPFRKSALTGSVVAAAISPMCLSISSSETPPSGLPREKAKPAEVVARASKPRCSRQIAVPTSHGLGRTKQPDSCNSRNVAAAANCLSFISQRICVYQRSLTQAADRTIGKIRFAHETRQKTRKLEKRSRDCGSAVQKLAHLVR